MSGCALLAEMTENLFIHMRAIRKITIHQENRAARSITDHFRIIEALERRDPALAERLAREHTLGLAAHVEQHGDFLDAGRAGRRDVCHQRSSSPRLVRGSDMDGRDKPGHDEMREEDT